MKEKEELKNLLTKSYAPYSNFRVASIVVMKDGTSYTGVNIENASYGATICAERVAIAKAVSEGYRKGDFEKLYVMIDKDQISTPCFLCRQVLVEFFEADKEVILYSNTGLEKHLTIKELCPYPFASEDLK